MPRLTVGSRGSALALAQTGMVMSALERLHPGLSLELRRISTQGDRVLDRSLATLGGKGVFVKEIEEALLAGQIDLAVHSLKDLPTEQPAGLAVGAVLERADPRDAVVFRRGLAPRPASPVLPGLPPGARVGTSSLRRAVQLRALRPDLVLADIRGNVDTRLRKLDEGQYDAIVLAAAGLSRLGLADRVSAYLEADLFLPAPGQGALAIEVRAGDAATAAVVGALDHTPTHMAVTAERAFLKALGGGCDLPIGVFACPGEDGLRVHGLLAEDGRVWRGRVEGPAGEAEELGRRLAAAVLVQRETHG